eukprot:scaffold4432_cov108-Skeletonema_dohrnii-CCMP3373.AAC.4
MISQQLSWLAVLHCSHNCNRITVTVRLYPGKFSEAKVALSIFNTFLNTFPIMDLIPLEEKSCISQRFSRSDRASHMTCGWRFCKKL